MHTRMIDDTSSAMSRNQTTLSVIVPTRNEAGNVARLVAGLEAALAGVAAEIIFVDDSDDETPAVIQALDSTMAITLIARPPERRANGLGGAVIEGFRAAQSPWLCVMDADLQHPPAMVAAMLQKAEDDAADLVIGSRLISGGDMHGLSKRRNIVSHVLAWTTKLAFPMRLRQISDPLTGLFLIRNGAVNWETLQPDGFKILLEIVVRSPKMRIVELPFSFGERHDGRSKASAYEVVRLLRHYAKLRYSADSYLIRFLLIGLVGLLNHTALLFLFTQLFGWHPLLAFVVASETTILGNWFPVEWWAFDDRRLVNDPRWRFVRYWGLNNALMLVSTALLWLLTAPLSNDLLPASLSAICAMTIFRWLVSDLRIWTRLPQQPLTRNRLAHSNHAERLRPSHDAPKSDRL